MDKLPYDSIIASQPFRFLVGDDKTEFFLHEALVAHQSKALKALVNGGLKESSEKCATLPSVDAPTFARFAQYAYSGNYEADTLESLPQHSTDDEQDNDAEVANREKMHYDFGDREQDFWDLLYPVPKELEVEPKQNSHPRQSCTHVFLAHAKLHVFADYYGIEALSNLTLHKLHRTLGVFKLFPERTADVNTLLRFCYDSEVHGLKVLLSNYASCHMDILWPDHNFQTVCSEYPDLSTVLMTALMEELCQKQPTVGSFSNSPKPDCTSMKPANAPLNVERQQIRYCQVLTSFSCASLSLPTAITLPLNIIGLATFSFKEYAPQQNGSAFRLCGRYLLHQHQICHSVE